MSETPSEPRPDPYEDELAQGFGQDSVCREDRLIPSGARLILKTLVENEASWRERLGDEDYRRALTHWHTMWGTSSRDPFGSDEEHQAFLEDLYRSRREGR